MDRSIVQAPIQLAVASDHPALPGHFPQHPIVPAVVILDLIVAELAQLQPQTRVLGIKRVKWLRPLSPDQPFTVEFGAPGASSLRFRCRLGDELMAEGNLYLRDEAAPQQHYSTTTHRDNVRQEVDD